MKNGVMLITYADSMGKNMQELRSVLNKHFSEAVKGIHILPFFPSSGDRGFSPTRYDVVDPVFGNWDDIRNLANDYYLMYDFMINHISSKSEYFKDFITHKDESPYADMFIRYKNFWPNGEPTDDQVDIIYKRKPRAPYFEALFQNGTSEKIWCTFSEDQIDLNFDSETTRYFIKNTLVDMAKSGASIIRLDAFAYTNKKPGTNCFFVEPDVWDMLESISNYLEPYNVEILPEMHEHYKIQLKLAEKGYWVYDFALPMLLLHSLYTGETSNLVHWLNICPHKQFTTLDTHDGIGVVDVRGLLSDEQIEATKDLLFAKGANAKRIYNTEAYNNLDIYQLNCTYYSALGDNDAAYLLARAIQIFAPGIPQIYYVGLLAGKNDIQLVETTKNGRDINRHYYTADEIEQEVKRPVVAGLIRLLEFRNAFPAFAGDCEVSSDGSLVTIKRSYKGYQAKIIADMKSHQMTITYSGLDKIEHQLNLLINTQKSEKHISAAKEG